MPKHAEMAKLVGERLKLARQAAGLTQARAAQYAGLSRTCVSLAESGRTLLGLASLAGLCRACRISAGEAVAGLEDLAELADLDAPGQQILPGMEPWVPGKEALVPNGTEHQPGRE